MTIELPDKGTPGVIRGRKATGPVMGQPVAEGSAQDRRVTEGEGHLWNPVFVFTGDLEPMRRNGRGFTFLEVLVSLIFLSGAVLSVAAMMSRDFTILTNNRIDFIGQTAVRRRMEYRRLQPFDLSNGAVNSFTTDLPVLSTSTAPLCQDFTNDPNDLNYGDLTALPFYEGLECAEYFDANRRRYTVITKVFDRPTSAPHQWRAVTVVSREGLNRP